MKKWLPYVIAAVLGIGVAVVAFGPGMGGGGKKEKVAKEEKDKPVKTGVSFGENGASAIREEGDDRLPSDVVADAKANPPPEPGTLRPMNAAEIEHAAKLARPINKHFDYTTSWWQRAGQLVGKEHPELAGEIAQMVRYVRDQGKLKDADLNQAAVIAKEKALVDKIRAAGVKNDELTGVLDYIEASGQAVLDGGDPTQVPKPGKTSAG